MTEVFTTVLAAILVLGLLIFVHELGHFLFAKWFDVHVLRFSIGFGPLLASRKVGETEYAISWIPLGGYVKMLGEEEEEEGEAPVDPTRSFAHQPLGRRFLIVFAGPLFNILSAWVLLLVAVALYGVIEPVDRARIGGVSEGLPAAEAGIETGDVVTAVDGQPVPTWEALAEAIVASKGEPVQVAVERDGKAFATRVTPESTTNRNIFGEDLGETWRIGIERAFETRPASLLEAPGIAATQVWFYSELIVISVAKMVQGKISARELGGPITIARVAGERAQSGLKGLLEFMAFLGINLGILNLLPIPVLDGGHLFFFGIEAIIRRPVEGRAREIAQQAGLFLLISLMLFAVYNDIYRWIQG